MLEKLENYLSKWTSKETSDLLLTSLETLQGHGFMSAWDEISVILESGTDQDATSILDSIHVIVEVAVDQILRAHSLATVHETSLNIKMDMLVGILRLQDFEDSKTILQFCDACDDPVQTFSDLLEFVTNRPWAEYAAVITGISPALIEKLAEIHRKNGDDGDSEEVVIEADPPKVVIFKKFVEKYPASMAAMLAGDLYRVGTPLGILLKMGYVHDRLGELQPLAPDQAAVEVMGIVLLSDVLMSDYARIIKDTIEDIYNDFQFVAKVCNTVDTLLSQVVDNG